MNSAGKTYGKGPKYVPALFQPTTETDPYCFESDDEPLQPSPVKPANKKSKLKNTHKEKKPLAEKKLSRASVVETIYKDQIGKKDSSSNRKSKKKDELTWTLSKELKKKEIPRNLGPSLSKPVLSSNGTNSTDPFSLSDGDNENDLIPQQQNSTGLSQPLDNLTVNSQSSRTPEHNDTTAYDFEESGESPSKRTKLRQEVGTTSTAKEKTEFDMSSDDEPESVEKVILLKPRISEKPKIDFAKLEKQKSAFQSSHRAAGRNFGSPKKNAAKYSYNPRSWQAVSADSDFDDDGSQTSSQSGDFETDQSDKVYLRKPLRMKKEEVYPTQIGEYITSKVKVPKEQKKLYKVVHNVRQAHECQDHGETVQLDDDLTFLLDGLSPNQPISGRYLSAVSLAEKCSNSTFRMHLKAESSLHDVFTRLSDAGDDPRLALSTCIVMYMLCQDRLNMDLDRTGLLLLVHLLDLDSSMQLNTQKEKDEYDKSLDTVYNLYKSAIPTGEELIDKCDLSAGYLAMECLLILTSRLSGEWFKEELRETGGIVTISTGIIKRTPTIMTADYLTTELNPEVCHSVRSICRRFRVLEHVTASNSDNQNLLIQQENHEFVLSTVRLLSFCEIALPYHQITISSKQNSSGCLLLQLLLGSLRLLVNLTQNSASGCIAVSNFSGISDILVSCVYKTTKFVLAEQRFDITVLSIGLLINLSEYAAICRQQLLDYNLDQLVKMFYDQLRAAEVEENAGATESQGSEIEERILSGGDDLNETLSDVLHRAGKHMEHTIVASYTALLLGVIVQQSTDYAASIYSKLTAASKSSIKRTGVQAISQSNTGYTDIMKVLAKFLSFMKMTDAVSGSSSSNSVENVIRYLQEVNNDLGAETIN